MAISDWSNLELCNDADVQAYESAWPEEWTTDPAKWRESAKRRIEKKLRFALAEQQKAVESDVLDLIANPEVLVDAAVFLTLHLSAQNNGQAWVEKRDYYEKQFDAEFSRQVRMLNLDIDESGTIDDGEKGNVNYNVRLTRGA